MQLELPSSVTAIGGYATSPDCYYLTISPCHARSPPWAHPRLPSCVRLTDFSVEEGSRHFNHHRRHTHQCQSQQVKWPILKPKRGRHPFDDKQHRPIRLPYLASTSARCAYPRTSGSSASCLPELYQPSAGHVGRGWAHLAMAFNNCDSLRSTSLLPSTASGCGSSSIATTCGE